MKNCSPPRTNRTMSNFSIQDNCDCLCHFPEECKIGIPNYELGFQNQSMCQNIASLRCVSPFQSGSSSPNRIITSLKKNPETQSMNILQRNISTNSLCVCDNVCDCPCHCVSCVCCPCVKDKSETQIDTSEYYKNLYNQIKSELELEKRRNDRMKYDKQIHKNNLKSSENEKKNLLCEIEKLKNKLNETLSMLEQEKDKNNRRDQELFNFKEEELPKLEESYENLIKKIKEDRDKKINYLNNQMNNLARK